MCCPVNTWMRDSPVLPIIPKTQAGLHPKLRGRVEGSLCSWVTKVSNAGAECCCRSVHSFQVRPQNTHVKIPKPITLSRGSWFQSHPSAFSSGCFSVQHRRGQVIDELQGPDAQLSVLTVSTPWVCGTPTWVPKSSLRICGQERHPVPRGRGQGLACPHGA